MCQKSVVVPNETILREAAGGKTVASKVVYARRKDEDKKEADDRTNVDKLPTFTLEEVAARKSQGLIWIIIHDYIYDVTDYQEHHPGGDLVLEHLAGKDATDAFENYHRANVSKYLLPRFFIGTVKNPVPVAPHVKDFRALRQELLQRGMFEVPSRYYYGLYAWLALLFFGSLFCTLACDAFGMHMLGAVLLGLFWQQFAGLGHDLGHTAVSKSFHRDHRVGSIIGSILTGLSTAWWKRNHNTHHVVCNSVEDDPNIQHMPLLAVSEKVIEKPYWSTYHDRGFMLTKVGAAIVSYQHYVFLPLMAFARFNLYALGIKHLMNSKYKSDYRQTEMLCILGIFPVWYGTLVSYLPTRGTMWAFVILSHAVTILLHLQIVISHWSMETYRKDSSNGTQANQTKKSIYDHDDWYMLQFRTTMDISCPAWLDWLHIGLEHQTVHHLYPTLPRPHLREVTNMVKQLCKKHGIEFCEMGFIAMIGDSLRVLKETATLARTGKYTRNHLAEALRAEG